MQIINDGLPEPVFLWILKTNQEYSRGKADISVTELIGPPKPRILKKRHEHEIVVPASSLLNVTLGNAAHRGIQEACKGLDGYSERRLYIEVSGWIVSGGMDWFKAPILEDWKTCNKWKTIMSKDGRVEEFEKQLNCYAHILRENKENITEAKIFALFKDWNKTEHSNAKKRFIPNESSGYPDREWLYFNVKLWKPDVAKKYVEKRVKIHQDAEKELPKCTSSETWSGRRCIQYCPPSQFCQQFKELKKEKEE